MNSGGLMYPSTPPGCIAQEKHVGGGGTLTEVEVDEQLTARRAAQPGFVGPSFSTIAGCDSNGAIIHYRAQVDIVSTYFSSSPT